MNILDSGVQRGPVRAPVFIVGAPRSGTTLLRVILNRHPKLAMFGLESQFFQRVYSRRDAFGDPQDPANRKRVVEAYLALGAMRNLKIDLNVLRERMMREGASWATLFASMLQAWADHEGKPHGGEKTPQHSLYAKTLCEWFPEASVIHLVRDPRAMLEALRRFPMATHSASMAARLWRSLNDAAREASNHPNYLLVKYEDLVVHPEEQLRRLCHHIGLEYVGGLMQPAAIQPVTQAEQRRAYQAISTAGIDLWREKLRPWQVRIVEAETAEGMAKYGYSRESTRATKSDFARAAAEAAVENSFKAIITLPRLFYRTFQPTNLAGEEKWMARVKRGFGHLAARPRAGA